MYLPHPILTLQLNIILPSSFLGFHSAFLSENSQQKHVFLFIYLPIQMTFPVCRSLITFTIPSVMQCLPSVKRKFPACLISQIACSLHTSQGHAFPYSRHSKTLMYISQTDRVSHVTLQVLTAANLRTFQGCLLPQ